MYRSVCAKFSRTLLLTVSRPPNAVMSGPVSATWWKLWIFSANLRICAVPSALACAAAPTWRSQRGRRRICTAYSTVSPGPSMA